MVSLDSLYNDLLCRFPALYELIIFHKGRVIFQRTNPRAHEGAMSIVFRNLTHLWAKRFSAPPETFQHRIAGRSNIRSATKSVVGLLVGIAKRDGLISSFDQRLGDLLPEQFTPDIDISTKLLEATEGTT